MTARRRRTLTRWLLCLAAVVFASLVGLWQAQAIWDFRRPAVDQSVGPGETAVEEGVSYRLARFAHAPDLPTAPSQGDPSDDSDDLVSALGGAELVLVVLSVERRDPARDPKTVFCDVTLRDPAGHTWRTDGTVARSSTGTGFAILFRLFRMPPIDPNQDAPRLTQGLPRRCWRF